MSKLDLSNGSASVPLTAFQVPSWRSFARILFPGLPLEGLSEKMKMTLMEQEIAELRVKLGIALETALLSASDLPAFQASQSPTGVET